MRLDPTDAGYGTAEERYLDTLFINRKIGNPNDKRTLNRRLDKFRPKAADQTSGSICPAFRRVPTR
jgi:hypothetical protein